ncbi:MAG: ribonuclease H family protein [Lactococcus lactis]|nr:ribonuclease H family protein [Lactococcus lactis]MDN6423727.1 ribonuclease H family protein [Tetragenococcus koreensis]MRM59497.1 reverse transcriptase-like protein [Lactococcus cremoris]MCT3116730.1 reverse transcriptase-like protein [Lactococcus lactis]MDN6011925.1 ribonuclease H family protein [Lactococcus lactis]MDN6034218.1 ribonuclease H family protein [Lactococcus lactis]
MTDKYYAVREGVKTGIFTSWNEAKKYVTGYSNAKYKSFSSIEDAKEFMNVDNNKKIYSRISDNLSLQAYVDGSFSESKNLYSYGVVILNQNKVIKQLAGTGNDKNLISMRNVAGELLGAMTAIEYAFEHNYEQIEIFYDYMGIEMWATGNWKSNKDGTKNYVEFISKYKNKINIIFSKVKAHSGVEYNELADKLATRAMVENTNNFIENAQNVQESLFEGVSPYENFFKLIMSQIQTDKEKIIIKIDNYIITEKRLDEFLKKCWKYDGNKIKDILEKNIVLDIEEQTLFCEMTNKNKKKYKYQVSL